MSIDIASATTTVPDPRWRRAAYVYGIVVALGIAYMVAMIPVQVSDCLGNLLQIQHDTWTRLIVNHFWNTGFLRPLLWAQIKGAFDLADGHYWLTFKAIHAAQLVLLAGLFVRLLRIERARDFAAVPVAVAVLVGLHTFSGTVREAFPVNSFLTVLVCTFAVMNLSLSRWRWWHDALALVIYLFILLTVESGLLVVAALVMARLVGLRGVSWAGVGACLLLTLGYFYLRFGPLAVGAPGLIERSTGFGFQVLDPPELMARFGAHPAAFYAYNIVCSIITVFFAEPRAGVWHATHAIVSGGEVPSWLVINLVSSALATALVVWYGRRRVVAWWRTRRIDDDDRIAMVCGTVLLANAVLSFPYTKDAIMSTGGACFAVLTFYAVREMLAVGERGILKGLGAAVVLVALSGTWAVRATALPHLLREQAFKVRNDWATVYPWLDAQHIELKDADARMLVEQLRREALRSPAPHPNIGRSPWRRLLDLN